MTPSRADRAGGFPTSEPNAADGTLDPFFFAEMGAAIDCLFKRYWVAELGIERGVLKLASLAHSEGQ